jgi:hypothetical protein
MHVGAALGDAHVGVNFTKTGEDFTVKAVIAVFIEVDGAESAQNVFSDGLALAGAAGKTEKDNWETKGGKTQAKTSSKTAPTTRAWTGSHWAFFVPSI